MKLPTILCLIILVSQFSGCAPTKIAEVGDTAPDFNLSVVTSSDSLNLEQHVGKPIVVNFWSTSCGACLQELPDLNRIHSDESAVVVGIALDEDPERVKQVLSNNSINFDVALGTQELFEQYDGYGIPYTLILDKSKTIRKRFRGKASYDDIATVLKKIEELESTVASNNTSLQ